MRRSVRRSTSRSRRSRCTCTGRGDPFEHDSSRRSWRRNYNMQRDRPDEMDKQWIDQHVEAYVDGELSRRDRRVVERAVATDPEVRDWVMTAQRVKRELREIPTAECPPDVTDAVIRRIEAMEPARP